MTVAAVAASFWLASATASDTVRVGPLELANGEVRLWVELVPTHPRLSEYKRTLVVSRGGAEVRQTLFPDTGGYGRLNIYRQSGEVLVVRGPFDALLVHLDPLRIEMPPQPTMASGKYVAALAQGADGAWRFIPAAEAGELPLEVTK